MLMNVSVKFVLRAGSVNVNYFFYTILLYSLTGWKVLLCIALKHMNQLLLSILVNTDI